jgi:hypothetical protein
LKEIFYSEAMPAQAHFDLLRVTEITTLSDLIYERSRIPVPHLPAGGQGENGLELRNAIKEFIAWLIPFI